MKAIELESLIPQGINRFVDHLDRVDFSRMIRYLNVVGTEGRLHDLLGRGDVASSVDVIMAGQSRPDGSWRLCEL